MTGLTVSLGLVAIVLAVLLRQKMREAQRLRRRIAVGAIELENLQQAFSRFAPDEVIERIYCRWW